MTISEIAKLAGVSISTVSKIMNHRDSHISPETRERVLSVVKEYNYSPYAFAQNNSASKTFLIGVLLSDVKAYGLLLDGIMEEVQNRGYRLIVCDSYGNSETELKHITALCKAKADGVIWEPVSQESISRQKYFEETGTCITWLNAAHPDSFSMDYRTLIQRASEYFIQKKHTLFSLLTDPALPEYDQILAGYKTALFDHQISFNPDSLLPINLPDWISRIKADGLTGVISTDYMQAARLNRLLKHYQYEIPSDFSIISLVDDNTAPLLPGDISTITIPFNQLGICLGRHIIEQCEQHYAEPVPFVPDCSLDSFTTLDVPPSIKQPHIIVVGSINIDTTLSIKKLPKLGEAITTSRHTILPGGKGINQAVGVAKLNHPVTILGNVGNDLETSLIYSCLREYGIDSIGIQKDKNSDTGRAYIQVQDDGESAITMLTGANGTLSAKTIRQCQSLFSNCAYCLLQTEIAIEAVEEAARIARSKGVKTILKPSSVSVLSDSLLENIDIFVPNQSEMALLCGEEPASAREELDRQADYFLRKGIGTVIITLGEQGCFLKNESVSKWFPAADFIPMDSTGGSDAFISALASYLLYGYDMESAICVANYAAGFCISRHGIVPALIDQISLEKYIQKANPELLKIGMQS